jgi:hypothetical protein
LAAIIKIACDRCGYRQRLTERPRQYRFPDRRTAIINQTLAWCRTCQRVVEAERLLDLSKIDEQIAEVCSGVERVRDWLTSIGRTAEEEVERLQEYKEWRLARKAAPKCLECGSTSIEAFPKDENGDPKAIQHAGCRGLLRAGYVGLALVREWPLPQHSSEGDFLTELLTEQEWDSWADPTEMLKHLEVTGRASNRKLRLFACACCRRIWVALPSEASRRAVEASESYADRQVKSGVRRQAEQEARSASSQTSGSKEPWKMYAGYAALHAAAKSAWEAAFSVAQEAKCAAMWYEEPHSERGVGERQERAAASEGRIQCDLLRDIFGPLPFRPVSVAPSWQTARVFEACQAMYAERAFDRMPELADALEEAGCDNREILHHCRSAGEHVRGCWVVDLVLGKS